MTASLRAAGHDPEACREFLAPDFVRPRELRPSFGHDVFLAQVVYRKAVPDIKLQLGSYLMSQGDIWSG